MSDDSATTRRDLLKKLAAGAAAATTLPVMHRLFVPPAWAGPSLGGSSSGGTAKAYVNFAINVQDFRYLSGSAETIVKLVNIFNKYGVKGDFYMTGPMTRKYKKSYPNAITKLKTQGICYHVRPPHPLFNGFDKRFENATADQLDQRIERSETKALNLSTAEFNDKEDGGFALVKKTFGRAPSTVGAPNDNTTIKKTVLEYYKEQGAQGVVWYHGEKNLGSNPYQYQYGLLCRPADIVCDQWKASGESSSTLWWNRYKDGYPSADGKPHKYIESRVASYSGKRPPFVISLIHDDNFRRSGLDPWIYTYWKDKNKENPRNAPYNLEADDPSSRRSTEEQSRILQAYGNMVEYCAQNYTVVTMADIAAMAT